MNLNKTYNINSCKKFKLLVFWLLYFNFTQKIKDFNKGLNITKIKQ